MVVTRRSLNTAGPRIAFLVCRGIKSGVINSKNYIFFIIRVINGTMTIRLTRSMFHTRPSVTVLILRGAISGQAK